MAYLTKSQVYEIKKNNDLDLMKTYCDMDKTNGFIHLEYAKMLIYNGFYSEAKEELKPLLGTKYDTAARYEFGKIAYTQKNYELSREHFRYACENTSYPLERDKSRFALAKLEFDCGNLEVSKKYYEELLDTSFDETSRFYLGRINYELGNYEEAKTYLKDILNTKFSIPAKYDLAKTEYALGNVDVARHYFKALIDDGYAKATYKLGELEFNESNYKEAEKYFEESKYPGLYLPKTKYLLGKKDEAIVGFKELLNSENLKEANNSALFLAIIYIKDQKYEEAFDSIKDFMSSYNSSDDGVKLKIALTLFKELGVFFYNKYPRLNDLTYSDKQLVSYDETRLLSHISENHINKEDKNNFHEDIDLYALLTEVKSKLTNENSTLTFNLNDMYHIDYPGIGTNGESILRVVAIPGTKEIITMFPVHSRRDEVTESDEEVDYNTRVDMLLNKITSLYNLSKTNDFEFSDAFSDSEKQLILNLFDIKTKKLTK